MKKIVKLICFFSIMWLFIGVGCKAEPRLPSNAVILNQIIYMDEVKYGKPQTVQLPNGTSIVYKLPDRVFDGQLIKLPDVKGEPPYYIRIKLEKKGN